MKLRTEDRLVELNGLKVKSYGIGDLAIFQQVARSSMYSDPNRACIQEYLSNGIDAMRERSRKDPSFEPSTDKLSISISTDELRITDCGIGISPERMENGFASYYSSSKRGSDDEIGGFGLGCKTAFADPNRDSFTVDTVYDDSEGLRKRYITYHFIDSNGLTSYAELSNIDSPDSSLGTTIILPIDESDIDVYIDVIKDVCRYWEKKPSILGTEFQWPVITPMFKGDRWMIETGGTLQVVMDGIPYKVNPSQFPEKYRKMFQSGAVLFFGTGELNVTSTRESLDYRGDTVAVIVEVLDEIRAFMEGKVEEVMSLNIWEAQAAFMVLRPFVDCVDSALSGSVSSSPRGSLMVGRSVNGVSTKDTGYFDYSSKFCVVLSASKLVNKGRLDSFLDAHPDLRVYVIKVPTSMSGDLIKFIAETDKRHPELKIRDVISDKYDLRSWPISERYKKVRRKAEKKKFSKGCLQIYGGGWSKIGMDELDALKDRRVYYVEVENLQLESLKSVTISQEFGISRVIAVEKSQLNPVPMAWRSYWKELVVRLTGRLKKQQERLKAINRASASELSEFCSTDPLSSEILRRRAFGRSFQATWRGKPESHSDSTPLSRMRRRSEVFIDFREHYPILKVVKWSSIDRKNGPLALKILRSYKGPGGLHDRSAFKSLISFVRESLRKELSHEILLIKTKIKKAKDFL
jgi:hypothetical protein